MRWTVADQPPADDDGRMDDRETEQIPRARFPRPTPRGARSMGEPYGDIRDDDRTLTEDELAGLRRQVVGEPQPSDRVLPLQREPSRLVEDYLFPNEKFRGEWRRHWIHLAKEFFVGLGATLLIGFITGFFAKNGAPQMVTVGVVAWLVVMIWVIWKVADWYFDRFILTSKRVMLVHGVITKNVAMMPLLRVTDMKYVQSPWGRIFRYGTFEIESAGQEQALRNVPHLPEPNELYLKIVEEMYEPEQVDRRLGSMLGRAEDDGT
jgi:membrane protein YdbS with pleckstrin-like domain